MKHTRRYLSVALLAAVLAVPAAQAGNSGDKPLHFEGTVESLQQYEVPEWFRDAKLGIYLHWGAYSVA